jgi:predicted transcriptional regulator
MKDDTRRSGRRPWGSLEEEVLASLWAADGPISASHIQAEVSGDLAYSTITTILSRLRAKGLVTRTLAGRAHVYAPAQDAAAHTAREMHSLLIRRDDRAAVLARFVSELSPEEEQVLHKLLAEIQDK